MRKSLLFLFALLAVLGGSVYAIQVDGGQSKSQSKVVFFVGRYGRTNALGTNGNVISKDRVVVWDTTSNDGVTINISTTSNDATVAGVTLDEIPGTSRDNTAANDESGGNWGRIQVYGRHADVSWDSSSSGGTQAGTVPAGSRVAVSAKLGGTVGIFRGVSSDITSAVSTDSLGFLTETPGQTDKTADIFVKTM